MVRRLLSVLAVLAAMAGLAVLGTAGASAANAATCRTTHTYTHTVSSAGSESWEWVTRAACGHDYQRWEHRVFSSYTGAWYIEDVYRNELNYPHYWQHTRKDAHSKTGVETVTNTYTSA